MTSQPTAAKASPRLTQLQHGIGAATEQERNKKERVEDVVDASSGTRHRSHDQRMEQLASTAAVERVPAVEVTAALRRQRFAGALPSDEVTLSHAVSRGVAGTPRQVLDRGVVDRGDPTLPIPGANGITRPATTEAQGAHSHGGGQVWASQHLP